MTKAVAALPPERVAFSVKEFCLALGIGRTKFYDEVKAGRIRLLKAGRKSLVPATERYAYLSRLSGEAA